MAISPFKTWAAGEILTASDLNSSFSHITTNGESLAWPATTNKDLNGNALILDSDADSRLAEKTDDVVSLTLQNVELFIFDGDVSSPVNGLTFTATASGSAPSVDAVGSDANLSLRLNAKGTGDLELGAGGSETDLLVTAAGSQSNVDLRFRGKGTGTVQLGDGDLAFPDADGSASQVIETDGAGTLRFVTLPTDFASADRVAFQQTTPSSNFSKDTGVTSNAAFRLVTGSVSSRTGGISFTAAFASNVTSDPTTLSSSEAGVGSHAHDADIVTDAESTGADSRASVTAGSPTSGVVAANSASASSGHTHDVDLNVNYYDWTIGEYT